jgi:hypothetical protein
MHGAMKQVLVSLLVLCILVIGGLASAQALPHEYHHSHHQKATHGTVFCSWLCAAGQAGEATGLYVADGAAPYRLVEPVSAGHAPTVSSSVIATRGPPTR